MGTVNDASLFVARCATYEDDIDYVCGRYILDAKSLMGVLSIGVDHICDVEIHTIDPVMIKKFRQDMELWCQEGEFK